MDAAVVLLENTGDEGVDTPVGAGGIIGREWAWAFVQPSHWAGSYHSVDGAARMVWWLTKSVPEATLAETESVLHAAGPDEPGVSTVQAHTISR